MKLDNGKTGNKKNKRNSDSFPTDQVSGHNCRNHLDRLNNGGESFDSESNSLFYKYRKILNLCPEIRQDFVDKYMSEINNGSFEIRHETLATALISQNILSEIK